VQQKNQNVAPKILSGRAVREQLDEFTFDKAFGNRELLFALARFFNKMRLFERIDLGLTFVRVFVAELIAGGVNGNL